MGKSHGHLRRLYARYNEQYFHNALPKDTAVRWDADCPQDAHAATYVVAEGIPGGPAVLEFEIVIDPAIRPFKKIYKTVLLHEMAHVKLHPYGGHGKKFDEEMLRLACAGAFNKIW